MDAQRRVDPRIRAHGRARIDITLNAKDEADWRRRWKPPKYGFPFEWGDGWVHSIEYKVDDFASEVGFFIDVMAMPVATFSPSYAFFCGPQGEFAFGVVAVEEDEASTPPNALRLQFNVDNVLTTMEELKARGVVFEQEPYPAGLSDDSLHTVYFRTPHGICIDLLGRVDIQDENREEPGEYDQEREDDSQHRSRKDFDRKSSTSGSNGGMPFMENSIAAREDEDVLDEVGDIYGEEAEGGSPERPALEPFTSEPDDEILDESVNDVLDEDHSQAQERKSSRGPGSWPRSDGSKYRSGQKNGGPEIKYVQLDDPYEDE